MDDLDLPLMTKMSFEHMRQKLKCVLNCVQDLTDNVDKRLITVEKLQDKLEYWNKGETLGVAFTLQKLFCTLKKKKVSLKTNI